MNQRARWTVVIIAAICFVIPLAASGRFTYDTAAADTLTPTPASEVIVLGSNAFVPHTNLYIVGEVQNNTSSNVRFVRIDATLRDASGNVAYAKHSYSKVGTLAPGATSPFLVIFSEPPEWASYDLAIAWDTTSRQLYPLQVLTRTSSFDSHTAYHVVGEIKNQYDEQVKFIQAFVTMYDASGEVIGTDSSYATPRDLDPGQTAFFDTRIYFWKHKPDTDKVATYRLQVYGTGLSGPPQAEQTPISLPTAQPPQPTQSSAPFPWGQVLVGILGAGALGFGGYKLTTWAIHRIELKRHLKVLRARTSNLLNACEPLLSGKTPEKTVLYQLFSGYRGEQNAHLRDDVYEWLRRSQAALDDVFDLRRKLVDSKVQGRRSLEQQVYDWEMLYVTLVGNNERILSLTNDELRTLLDPVLVLDREKADVQLTRQLDDIRRELAGGMPLKVELMIVDPTQTDAEGILGYLDLVKARIAYVRDSTTQISDP